MAADWFRSFVKAHWDSIAAFMEDPTTRLRSLSQTLHVCHICRSVGVVLGVNGAAYGIHGVSGHFPSPKPAEMKQPSRERKNYFFTNELGNERLTLPETIMEVGSGLL